MAKAKSRRSKNNVIPFPNRDEDYVTPDGKFAFGAPPLPWESFRRLMRLVKRKEFAGFEIEVHEMVLDGNEEWVDFSARLPLSGMDYLARNPHVIAELQ